MDFFIDLPMVSGYNGFMCCIDKYSKFTRLVPVQVGENALSAPEVARLFFDNIVRLFGVHASVFTDRDPRFTAAFWLALW